MEGVLQKTIEVAGIEQKKFKEGTPDEFVKYTVVDAEKNKYFFFQTKKDGTDTRAYKDMVEGIIQPFKHVNIAYKEEDRTFTNDKGKLIEYKSRQAVFFSKPE